MKIIHLNATSVRNKINSISQYLHSNKIAVASICETFLNPSDSFALKNYTIIRADRANTSNRGGGVLIAVRKDLNVKKLNIPSSVQPIEACACEVSTAYTIINFISLYLPPRSNCDISKLNNILPASQYNNTVVCGDFNAHHNSWGGSFNDPRGRQVLDFFDSINFVLLNDGSMTFFGPSQSALDLTFCSPNLALRSTWHATNDSLGSTHCVTQVEIAFSNSSAISPKEKIPRKINKAFLNKKLKEIFESSDFSYEQFIQDFRNSFQIKEKKKDVAPNAWWNVECSRANTKLKSALSTYRSFPSRQNYADLQAAQKNYKYIIRREKAIGWKNFCANIDSTMSVGDFWRIIKRFKGSPRYAEEGLK